MPGPTAGSAVPVGRVARLEAEMVLAAAAPALLRPGDAVEVLPGDSLTADLRQASETITRATS